MGEFTDKTCIVGVGETPHMRPSNRTTLSMAIEAVKNACDDAGIRPQDVDGITSYNAADSTSGMHIASALGMRLNYQVDIMGGGSSTEALIAHAVGLVVGGYCNTMVVFRSMNGRSGRRMGGQAPGGPMPPTPITAPNSFEPLYGFTTPAQKFGISCMRYMRDYGLKSEQLGMISVAHRKHALLNPKSIMTAPITIEDYMNSRWVSKPFHLLDCCLETDVGRRPHHHEGRTLLGPEAAAGLHHGRHGAHDGGQPGVELQPRRDPRGCQLLRPRPALRDVGGHAERHRHHVVVRTRSPSRR